MLAQARLAWPGRQGNFTLHLTEVAGRSSGAISTDKIAIFRKLVVTAAAVLVGIL